MTQREAFEATFSAFTSFPNMFLFSDTDGYQHPITRTGFAMWMAAKATQPVQNEWTLTAPDGTRFTGPSPGKTALKASRHHAETDPAAAKRLADAIETIRKEGEAEHDRCIREYGTLDCPACGGSGHIGDVKQPAQVPAWQPIESGFPATGIPVLADIGEKYPIRACWIAKFTQEVGASDFEGDDDYDEATDTTYWPEGWYEWNRFDETHWLVDKPVKNWALLPAAQEVK